MMIAIKIIVTKFNAVVVGGQEDISAIANLKILHENFRGDWESFDGFSFRKNILGFHFGLRPTNARRQI